MWLTAGESVLLIPRTLLIMIVLLDCSIAKSITGPSNSHDARNSGDIHVIKNIMRDYVQASDSVLPPLDIFGDGRYPMESMLTLYRRLTDGHTLHKASETIVSHATDTVRSYTARGRSEHDLHFQITPLPDTEVLHKAEIRVLKDIAQIQTDIQMRVFLTIKKDARRIRTHVYHVKPISRSEHLAIDVTTLARPWIEGYKGGISLQAQIKTCSNVTCGPVQASSSHMLLFTQDDGFLEELHRSGAISFSNSSSIPHAIEKRDTSRSPYSNSRRKNVKDKFRTKKRRRICSSSKLMVDFKHLGWAKYIVIPLSYDARLCRGSCPSPVKPELSPTNHALIQSLMRLGNSRRIPMPCCAPKNLLPLSMLYYHGEEVVIRHHKDMIVESCACR